MELELYLPVLILIPAACTALGAAGVFFLRRRPDAPLQRALLGFAAGVMLAASVFSLLLPAIEQAQAGPLPGWLTAAAGLCIGAFGLLWLERRADCLLHGGCGSTRRMVLAITLHNLPEGMVLGLALALALQGAEDALPGALALCFGIALQNIPEGAAVSLPLRHGGYSRGRAFCCGAASGLVEPLGAVIALALAGWVAPVLPWLMAMAAGAMVCVTAQEMIPEAAKGHTGTVSVILGFALMMALDVAL